MSIFPKYTILDHFLSKNWDIIYGSFVTNKGVEIDLDAQKYRISMVLCYKCFEGKHDVCMGKQGLFVCDCMLCKKDSKSVNNTMPESVRNVEKH